MKDARDQLASPLPLFIWVRTPGHGRCHTSSETVFPFFLTLLWKNPQALEEWASLSSSVPEKSSAAVACLPLHLAGQYIYYCVAVAAAITFTDFRTHLLQPSNKLKTNTLQESSRLQDQIGNVEAPDLVD